jgi:hypothetical protein
VNCNLSRYSSDQVGTINLSLWYQFFSGKARLILAPDSIILDVIIIYGLTASHPLIYRGNEHDRKLRTLYHPEHQSLLPQKAVFTDFISVHSGSALVHFSAFIAPFSAATFQCEKLPARI